MLINRVLRCAGLPFLEWGRATHSSDLATWTYYVLTTHAFLWATLVQHHVDLLCVEILTAPRPIK